MSWTLNGRPLRRVLVSRLRYLGDVVMSTVVMEILKRGDPGLEIDYLCESAHAPVLDGHPQLARIHALGVQRRGDDAAARSAVNAANTTTAAGTLATAWGLRRRRHDLAIDLFFNPRSAWLLALGGARQRIGGTTSKSRKHLYTHVVTSLTPDQRPGLYRVAGGGLGEHLGRLAPLRIDGQPFLDWIEATATHQRPRPRIAAPEPDANLRTALADLGTGPGRYTLLAPGATWASKMWPVELWQQLIRQLGQDGHAVVVLQPPGRPDLARDLADHVQGAGGALPAMPLRSALAALAGASRVISVDGGIMHAAVGMGRPTLALFGPTDPRLWFPYEGLGPFRVLATRPSCHPCHRHQCDEFICLPELTADSVLAALPEPARGGDR